MPVQNETKYKDLDDASRRALYTALSPLNYRDIELSVVDEKVAATALAMNCQPLRVPPSALRDKGLADAFLYADVVKVSKFWFLLYSHIKFRMDIRLIDARTGKLIYSDDAVLRSRHFDIPTSVEGAAGALFTTIWHLRESELDNILDEFGERLTKEFPNPEPIRMQGVAVDAVFVNASEPILHAGDTLEVEVRGSPGKKGRFDIGTDILNIPLREVAPGIYKGIYQIRPGDRSDTGVVRAYLKSADGVEAALSNLKSEFRIAASTPARPEIQRVRFVKDSVELTINQSQPGARTTYEIYRTEDVQKGFDLVAQSNGFVWNDRDVVPGYAYIYVVKARTADGNTSQVSPAVSAKVPARGPVELPNRIAGDYTLNAFSSPYRVIRPCTIAAGAKLSVEPGVVIDVSPSGGLRIEGEADFAGTDASPILVRGASDGVLIDFSPASQESTISLKNVRLERARQGIAVHKGNLDLVHCDFSQFDKAIVCDNARNVKLSRCRFDTSHTAMSGNVGRLDSEYSEYRELSRGISVDASVLTLSSNDFPECEVAVTQLGPSSATVDNNFFDSTDPIDLLQIVQGPCVFQQIFQTRSSERLSYAPFPESYATYRARGDRFYDQHAPEAAMRAYLSAWWLRKERIVGERLVDTLLACRETEAAVPVARTLAILFPGDPIALGGYADVLDRAGYAAQAESIRKRLPQPEKKSLIRKTGDRIKRGVDFIAP
jgi:hypothetical protein